jgi:hypothetical protein
MPLDTINGETLDNLKTPYMVGRLLDWAGTPFFNEAAKIAEQSFIKSGHKNGMVFGASQVLVQMYPFEPMPILAFVFCATVGEKEFFTQRQFILSPQIVGELKVTGKWPSLQ